MPFSQGVPEQGASKQGSQSEREIQKLEQPPSAAKSKSDLESKYGQGEFESSQGNFFPAKLRPVKLLAVLRN